MPCDNDGGVFHPWQLMLCTRQINGRAEGVVCENGKIPKAVLEQSLKLQADFLVLGLASFK